MDRQFHRTLVRRTCEKIYGGKVSPDAWGRWKKWAKVAGQSCDFTFEQFCFMAAIAQCRSENRFAELSARRLKTIACSDEMIQTIGALINHIDDQGWALGWDVKIALSVRGIEVDGSTLKRVIPGMRPNCWYQVDTVIRLLETAGSDSKAA